MKKSTNVKKKVCINLDEDIYDQLKAIADYKHTTMSQWITDNIIATVKKTKEIDLTEYFR